MQTKVDKLTRAKEALEAILQYRRDLGELKDMDSADAFGFLGYASTMAEVTLSMIERVDA